jgi:hypothetical protein
MEDYYIQLNYTHTGNTDPILEDFYFQKYLNFDFLKKLLVLYPNKKFKITIYTIDNYSFYPDDLELLQKTCDSVDVILERE